MDYKKLTILVFGGLAAIALVWVIFAPRPEKFEEADPGTSIGSGWSTYTSDVLGFSIQYPPGFTPDSEYVNESLGPGRQIRGVAFLVPDSMTRGTNLSPDTKLSVERVDATECTPSEFLAAGAVEGEDATLGDYDYQYAETGGAAAGNLYDEYVYALQRDGSACYGIRFFVHSTQIGNYEPGAVREFDREDLLQTFRDMAATLTVR